jgi:DNA-binding IclR family transcriptional regulator
MVLLKALARLGGRASLTVLARHVDENPAKVHRYLISMMEEGLVDQDAVSLQYALGPEAIQIGLAAMRLADPIRVAEPALIRLRQELEMTCFIAVMGNKGPTIVRFEEPGLPVTLNVRVGSVLSLLWSATGRVFLAYLDDTRVERLAAQELAGISSAQRASLHAHDPIAQLKQQVRSAGMAVVRDTNLQGISAIGVPIFDFSNRLAAVLTVLGASGSFEASVNSRVAQALRVESLAISQALGHKP